MMHLVAGPEIKWQMVGSPINLKSTLDVATWNANKGHLNAQFQIARIDDNWEHRVLADVHMDILLPLLRIVKMDSR